MAHENLDGIYSLPAAADFSASQYCGVVINSSGQYALAGAGAVIDGVLHNRCVAGAMARAVNLVGVVVKVKLAGTVALGDKLSTNGSGAWVKSVTAGHAYNGKALRAGVSGDVIEMMRLPDMGVVP